MVEIYRDNVLICNVNRSTCYVDSGLNSDTTYTYTLVPYNKNGLAGKEVSIQLRTESSGSESDSINGSEGISGESSRKKSTSSGDGGGGAPTGDRYENVLLKEVQNIFVTKDKHITYSFKKEGNKITSIQFLSLKNSGNIQATIEVLKDKSSFAKSMAPGKIYQQMNIWVGKVGFVVPENVNDLKVNFKVEKKWLEENNIETDTVKLYRYADSSWKVLPTTTAGEDESYIYFESQTPGFSPFAIISEAEAQEVSEDVMKSVNEEAKAMAAVEDAYPADKNTVKSKLNVFPMVVCVIAILLAGAYIVYRKRDERST
jgi:PGF-pre-PGF domain-containing protein